MYVYIKKGVNFMATFAVIKCLDVSRLTRN